jgi:signal transduction histidine kinase
MTKPFALFCLLCFSYGLAQIPKSADSLAVFLKNKPRDTTYVLALNEYAFLKIQEGKFDVAQKTIQQMQALSEKWQFGLGFYKVMNMRGVVEYSKQNSEKAMDYFLRCNTIIQQYKLPKKFYQNSLNNIGIIYDQMGDRENATAYSMKLIEFQEKNHLEPLKTNPYDQIGKNLKFFKKYDEALPYFNKALAIETRYKNYTGMAISENSLGNLYDDLQKPQEAIKHFVTGLRYAEKVNYQLLQTDLLINLGRMYQQLKWFEKAAGCFEKSEQICKQLEVTKPLKTLYQSMGDLYFFQKQYPKAEQYYLKSLAIAETIDEPEYLYSINQALADLKEKTGNYKAAFNYKVQAEIYKDSTFKLETAQHTENLLRKYEAQKKEQEIVTLSAQNTVKNLQIDNANKQKWYFIFGILALGIIGGLLFYQSRNRKKVNEKLQLLNNELDQANKVKTRFFSILNHDLRSPVSNLIHFLHLQKENPELLDEESKKRMENKTILGAENLLTSMEDILLWSKGQMERFEPQLVRFSVDEIFADTQSYFASEKIKIQFKNQHNLEVFTDKDYLKTIIRNLTGNALKALSETSNPSVVWTVFMQDEKVVFSITDNGPGADQSEFKALYDENEIIGVKSGLGLHLIRDLAKAIQAEIKVKSTPNQGTTIDIWI